MVENPTVHLFSSVFNICDVPALCSILGPLARSFFDSLYILRLWEKALGCLLENLVSGTASTNIHVGLSWASLDLSFLVYDISDLTPS